MWIWIFKVFFEYFNVCIILQIHMAYSKNPNNLEIDHFPLFIWHNPTKSQTNNCNKFLVPFNRVKIYKHLFTSCRKIICKTTRSIYSGFKLLIWIIDYGFAVDENVDVKQKQNFCWIDSYTILYIFHENQVVSTLTSHLKFIRRMTGFSS